MCIETKDLTFDDYLFLRGLALLVESLYNGRPFSEFFRYSKIFGIELASLLNNIYENISNAPIEVQTVMNEFAKET